MGTSKILIDGVGIDLTQDTVAANKMLSGIKAHDSNGDSVTGSILTYTGTQASGTKSITANGVYDVTQFASAEVNVPAPTVNSKIFNITLASDMEVNSSVTVVSGDSDLAEHYDASSLVVSFLTRDASGSNYFINGIMSNRYHSKNGTGGYGLRYSTSMGGISMYAPNVSTGNGIKITADGDMIFVSNNTYKFNAGTYEVIVAW